MIMSITGKNSHLAYLRPIPAAVRLRGGGIIMVTMNRRASGFWLWLWLWTGSQILLVVVIDGDRTLFLYCRASRLWLWTGSQILLVVVVDGDRMSFLCCRASRLWLWASSQILLFILLVDRDRTSFVSWCDWDGFAVVVIFIVWQETPA